MHIGLLDNRLLKDGSDALQLAWKLLARIDGPWPIRAVGVRAP